jgi:hypothetical protein
MKRFVGQPVTMIEIGVTNGSSLFLWRDFLGPQAKLVGLDIAERKRVTPPGSQVFIGDQADPEFLKRVVAEVGAPTILLDDGGHTMRQMITTFEVLYPLMPSPSVYIIEDTHTAFRKVFLDDPKGRTIYDVAFDVTKRLQEWTGPGGRGPGFKIPLAERTQKLPVSDICRMTRSVSFFDSMIIFQREERPEPLMGVPKGQ